MNPESFEARIRSMAEDRLADVAIFSRHTASNSSQTNVLLAMCDTLRSCLRDWPHGEKEENMSIIREESACKLSACLKKEKYAARETRDDSLIFVLAEALLVMAEQWPGRAEATKDSPVIRGCRSPVLHASLPSSHASKASSAADLPTIPIISNPGQQEDEEEDEMNEEPSCSALAAVLAASKAIVKREPLQPDHLLQSWTTEGCQEEEDAMNAGESSPNASDSFLSSLTGIDYNKKRAFKFHCRVCGIGCVARAQLDAHMNIHTGQRPFACEMCDKRYKRKDHLTDHFKKSHPAEYLVMKKKRDAAKAKQQAQKGTVESV